MFHKTTDDPVNINPAADVGATTGTLVSLPKQLSHQRLEVSPAMMDDSDKLCHPLQPVQLKDLSVLQRNCYRDNKNKVFNHNSYSRT